MSISNSIIRRLLIVSAVISLALVLGTLSVAQDELPPVPSFTPQAGSSSDSMQPLPGLDNPPAQNPAPLQTSVQTSSNGNDAARMANSAFQANFRKPFVGQNHGPWPPSFGIARPASAQVALASNQVPSVPSTEQSSPDLPPLPSEPETASVNPPVAQVPVIGVPGTGQNVQRQPMNPYSQTPAPAAQNPYQQTPYQQSYQQTPYQQTPYQQTPYQQTPYQQRPYQPAPQTPAVPSVPQVPQTPAVPSVPQVPQTPAVPSVPQVPQNQPYSSPTISPVQPQVPAQPMRPQPAPAQAQNQGYMFQGGSICPLNIRPPRQGEHPMAGLIPWATEGLQAFNAKIRDYSCVMTKRERMDGQLQESSTLYMKIREQPFSIYVKYLKPDKKAGIEALYRKGYHNDQLLGHDVGIKAIAGSLWLDPNGRMAMAGQKYPITDGGIPNLVRKMIDTVQAEMKNDPQGKETFVKFVGNGGNIDGRPCIRVDVLHPVPRPYFRFHRAEIYIDKEWGVPVRYAAWLWPEVQGGKPILDEEFTYSQLRFNCGFTDWDFNEKNKEYKF